jgi:hypothetical protein
LSLFNIPFSKALTIRSKRAGYNPILSTEMKKPSRGWVYIFLEGHSSLKTIKPVELNRLRIIASLWENVNAWLEKARGLIAKKKYPEDLIFQMDETSCLVHSSREVLRIVASKLAFLPALAKAPIYHLTVLFIAVMVLTVNRHGGGFKQPWTIEKRNFQTLYKRMKK